MEPIDNEKRLRLMLRQLNDAQTQAQKLLSGRPAYSDVETFARSCGELNDYIRRYSGREDVIEALDAIPQIEYERWGGNNFAHFLLWWLLVPGLVHDVARAKRRSAVLEQIRLVREKYGMLELQLRGMKFDSLS